MTQGVVRPATSQARARVATRLEVSALSSGAPRNPRIAALAAASPTHVYEQSEIARLVQGHILGADWATNPQQSEIAKKIAHIFSTSGVRQRQVAIDLDAFYSRRHSTGERMAHYETLSYQLGRRAVEACIDCVAETGHEQMASEITDFVLTSCTGYATPGLDIQLARDLGMRGDVRRVNIGHVGCHAAVVGLRQGLATMRANPGARLLQLSLELSSLHWVPSLDPQILTCMALFGDAASTLMLTDDQDATGPEVVDAYCAADFATADQLTWKVTDEGFAMTLSPRVPISLKRTVRAAVEHLLAPHALEISDVAHWMVHPGGPSILDVVQEKLELSDEQMEDSRQVLAEHGNCSSATILLILERLVHSGRAKAGEWAVMMAFGPGLTIETCLLRF